MCDVTRNRTRARIIIHKRFITGGEKSDFLVCSEMCPIIYYHGSHRLSVSLKSAGEVIPPPLAVNVRTVKIGYHIGVRYA